MNVSAMAAFPSRSRSNATRSVASLRSRGVGAVRVRAQRSGVGGVALVLVAVTPPLGRRGVAVFVVPVPPCIRRGLGVALRRVLPLLLAPERSQGEVAPGAPHRRVAAALYKGGAER